jgi:hypothetical protein
MPPKFPRILRYLAVDETCQDRLLCEEGIPESRIEVHFNSVDLARFTPRGPLPAVPRRALIFSNSANEKTHVPVVQEACTRLGIQLDVVGQAAGQPCSRPETILGNYDLVFAKARCALEALAVGAAVVLCDTIGIGEMVTLSELTRLRRQNFGWRSLHNQFDVDLLVKEIKRYDPDDTAKVSERIRETEELGGRIHSMLTVYREVITEYEQLAPSNADVELQSTARYLEAIASTTNTFHLAELQKAFRTIAEAFSMQPLIDSDQECIRFTTKAVPSSARVGESFTVEVELENHSSRLLCSYAPNPLRFSYHWLDAADSKPIVYEGRRTDIYPPLQPGGNLPYTIQCDAPLQEGTYILRLTLVQESIKWFDQGRPDHRNDFIISVTR